MVNEVYLTNGEMIETPFDFPIRLKLELYDKEDNLIYSTDFYNKLTAM